MFLIVLYNYEENNNDYKKILLSEILDNVVYMRSLLKLKIVSYNIHKGHSAGNIKYSLNDIRSLIQSLKADIVFLQEVVGENIKFQKNQKEDKQFEFLAHEIWPHYTYGKNAIYDHGHHGNLILSKYPIVEFSNIDLTTNRYEKRGLLSCKIQLPLQSTPVLYAFCSHLNLFHRGRKKQYSQIQESFKELIDDNSAPVVFAGDFNDWNKKASSIFEKELHMREGYKYIHGQYAKTFPAFFPFLSLDRVYLNNVKVVESYVYDSNEVKFHSDHLPLVCEVEIEGDT